MDVLSELDTRLAPWRRAKFLFFQWPLAVLQLKKNPVGSKNIFPIERNTKTNGSKTADRTTVTSNAVPSKSSYCRFFGNGL